jgi:hypothetical protein
MIAEVFPDQWEVALEVSGIVGLVPAEPTWPTREEAEKHAEAIGIGGCHLRHPNETHVYPPHRIDKIIVRLRPKAYEAREAR